MSESKRLLVSIAITFAFSVVGCNKPAPAIVEETNAFGRFKEIDSITLSVQGPEAKTCEIPKSRFPVFEAILEHGVRDPNRVKRSAEVQITVSADGKKHHWSLLYLSDEKYVLFIEIHECWQVSRSEILKFVEGCSEVH